MGRKCGIIFNRHKWHYETPNHRICTKCGQCQIYTSIGFDLDWMTVGFDYWQISVKNYKEVMKAESKEREKAFKFLKEKGLI